MARARKAQPVLEAMQIIVYMKDSTQPVVVRYTDQSKAIKDFDKLLAAADHGKGVVLTTPAMTAVFRAPQEIAVAYLVDVETNNGLIADTQRRMHAMQQLP